MVISYIKAVLILTPINNMNDNQFDQFVRRLNYLSRWTLANPHYYALASPLLPPPPAHPRLSADYYQQYPTQHRAQYSQHSGRQQQKKSKDSSRCGSEGGLIRIEEADGDSKGREEQLQTQRESRRDHLILVEEDMNSQIKIEEDPQMSVCSSQEEEYMAALPQSAYQHQQTVKANSYLPQSPPSQRQQDADWPQGKHMPNTSSREIVIEESEWEQQSVPTMSRNYTFGSSLTDSNPQPNPQPQYSDTARKGSHPRYNYQYEQEGRQYNYQFEDQPGLTDRQQKKLVLGLLIQQEDYAEMSQSSDINSPKFSNITTHLYPNAHLNSTQSFKNQDSPSKAIKKGKASPKRADQSTSPKRRQSSSPKKKQSSSSKKKQSSSPKRKLSRSLTKGQTSREKVSNNPDQQQSDNLPLSLQKNYFNPPKQPKLTASKQIHPAGKQIKQCEPFAESIAKIDQILNILPAKLRQAYEAMRQHLVERQAQLRQQIGKQTKQLIILRMLKEMYKIGYNIDTYVLQPPDVDERILLNQIKLRLAIKVVATR